MHERYYVEILLCKAFIFKGQLINYRFIYLLRGGTRTIPTHQGTGHVPPGSCILGFEESISESQMSSQSLINCCVWRLAATGRIYRELVLH